MPEYSASIDIYMGKWVVVSEYAAPDTIDPEDAKRRLGELVRATEKATGIDEDFIYVKERSRQKGKGQYTSLTKAVERKPKNVNRDSRLPPTTFRTPETVLPLALP